MKTVKFAIINKYTTSFTKQLSDEEYSELMKNQHQWTIENISDDELSEQIEKHIDAFGVKYIGEA